MASKNLKINSSEEVILVAAIDKERFPVSRKTVSESSKYFEEQLKGAEKELELDDVDGATLSLIICFICTGDIEFTSYNIESILCAASEMKLTSLTQKGEKYLEENLKKENCVNSLVLADKFYIGALYEKALKLVCEHFANISIVDISKLNGYVLNDIIQSGPTDGSDEENLVFCLIDWYSDNENERAKFVPDMLRAVRLDRLSEEFMRTVAEPLYKFFGMHQLLLAEYEKRKLSNKTSRPEPADLSKYEQTSIEIHPDDQPELLRVTPDIREESERSACDLINFLNDSPTDLLVEPQTSTSKTCDSYQQGKPLQCHLCGKSYQYQGWLSRHLDQVHGTQAPTSTAPVAAPSNAEEAKSLQCHFCNKSYKYQGWLARHLQQIHGTQDSSSIPRSTTVEPPQAKPLKCHICGKGYQLQGWLDRHVDQVHSDQISIGAQASSNLSTPSTAGQAKPLQCHICGKDYQFQGWLDRHVDQVHSTQRSTSAPASPKLSTSSSVGQAKPLQCHICSKGYEYQGWLDRHMQQKHGTQSSPVYRSGASQSSARSTSINSTLEAKPLQCHLCGKGYVYQGWLNNHLRDVHGSSQSSRAVTLRSLMGTERSLYNARNDKPLHCHICGKGYMYQGWLNRHMQSEH